MSAEFVPYAWYDSDNPEDDDDFEDDDFEDDDFEDDDFEDDDFEDDDFEDDAGAEMFYDEIEKKFEFCFFKLTK